MTVARAFDMVALIKKAPRNTAELAELVGVQRNTATEWAKLLEGEGLVVRNVVKPDKFGAGRETVYWTWQP